MFDQKVLISSHSTSAQLTDARHTQHETIAALNTLAAQLEFIDMTQAYQVASNALHLAQSDSFAKLPDTDGMAHALLTMASINERRGDYQASIQQATEALALFEALALPTGVQSCYYILGWNYYALGDYAKSMALALQQLTMAEAVQHTKGQADAHNLLGALYSAIEPEDVNFPLSINHYEQSLALYRTLGSLAQQATLLNNLCVTYESMNRYADALSFGISALELSRQIQDLSSEVVTLGNLGIVYAKLHAYDQALDYYTLRLKLARAHGYRPWETHTLLCIGRLYVALDDLPKALDYLQQALALAEQFEYRKWIHESHAQLALVYERQGRFAEALAHYKQFHIVEASVLGEQSRSHIECLKIAYQLEKMQRDLQQERQRRDQDHQQYQRLAQLKDDLINTASHDLKNPLAGIFISLDLLERYTIVRDERGQALLGRIRRAADQMRTMIHQLLDKALIETGQALALKPVVLATLLQSVLADVELLAIQQHVQLTLHPPASNGLTVTLDSDRMRQTLNNLLVNALKYTPRGGQVSLTAHIQHTNLILEVSDTGIGIPAEALPHLFIAFYRVQTEAHRAVEGTGLGLSIVKAIIDQHNGSIQVTSTEGSGTRFSITLPGAVVITTPLAPAQATV
ncbi:MAG: tetratricopeptide repeat protein [Armatimonadetes bacterium]|nr:tetratricopeptide repeat protein [Anaerolineae bacterium]